jgi:AAA domain
MTTLDKLLQHFSLTALPFDRAVPPEGLLHHPSFTEALERLRFAVDSRGPGLLVAAPGTGKSIVLDTLCTSVTTGDVRVIATALSSCGPFGLVGQLAARYGTPLRRTTAQTAAALLDELGRSPRIELLILDEAHRLPDGLDRLAATVAQQRARLLILDPLIRVHRADENSAAEMAAILDGLRAVARATDCAVLLVHHTRKAPAGGIAGHALRGSSDLHAFGDTNLYLRRLASDGPLELRIEHRAASSPPPLRVHLRTDDVAGQPQARFVSDDAGPVDPLRDRVLALVQAAPAPVPSAALRTALGVRKQTLLALLHQLADARLLRRVGREGWTLGARPVPDPDPTGSANGNRSGP